MSIFLFELLWIFWDLLGYFWIRFGYFWIEGSVWIYLDSVWILFGFRLGIFGFWLGNIIVWILFGYFWILEDSCEYFGKDPARVVVTLLVAHTTHKSVCDYSSVQATQGQGVEKSSLLLCYGWTCFLDDSLRLCVYSPAILSSFLRMTFWALQSVLKLWVLTESWFHQTNDTAG